MAYINFDEPSIFAETSFGKKKAAYKSRRSYKPRRSYTPRNYGKIEEAPRIYDPDRERMRGEEKIKLAKLNASMTPSERSSYWLRMSRFGNTNSDIKYLRK